uniref:Vacuolar protein sorting-associated protein 26 n=1 Tax=Trepomonas sp. PC1 TaxID=1076344 RepID=A0A146K5X1_9EUKA|eukprot:JAP91026.1 Vacuolar protein sorting-associated protein 26 [Trepomonas sp. PC1]
MFGSKAGPVKFDFAVPAFKDLPIINREDEEKQYPVSQINGTKQLKGTLTLTQTSKVVNHDGVQVELVGQVLMSGKATNFFSKILQIGSAGSIAGSMSFNFDFSDVELSNESVCPAKALIQFKYYLIGRVMIKGKPVVGQLEFHLCCPIPRMPVVPNKSEVGAENALQIEIDVPNTNLDITKDIFTGKVHFINAQKKMEEMRIMIKRREAYRASAADQPITTDWFEVTNYQVMDGAPFRNEVIPMKLRLQSLKSLTPSVKTDFGKIEYQILLCVQDTDGQSYYKDIPIVLYRGE